MSSPLLLIRADADTAMGTGHVMRTLAVAQAWRLAGGSVTYLTSALPDALRSRLGMEGCHVELWEDVEAGTAEDGRRVRDAALSTGAEGLIVDGYQFGETFRNEAASRLAAPSLLIHDLEVTEPLWLDFVLNQNPHAQLMAYPRTEAPRQLLGLGWAMLRREFLDATRPRRNETFSLPARILVTLGGGDAENLTARVLRALEAADVPLDVRVVVGAANPHLDALRALASRSSHRIGILHHIDDMPAMMRWADLAVASAGSTSWELAWMGVPWLSLAVAENQRYILRELGARGMAVPLGWHEDVNEERIAGAVQALIDAPDAHRGMAARATRAVDGRGAERVAALLRGQG